MGVKFLPFSSDPRAAAAPCPPLPPAAGSARQGTRGAEGTAVRSHLVPPRWQTRPLDADGLETHRECCGQLENRLSPEPCCAVPCCSVPFRAVGSPRTSHEGQQRGHTSQGVPTQRCWGSRESQGLFPAPVPGVSGDPPASFPFRGGSAAPERIKLRKTTEVTAPSLHSQTCPLCRDWPCPLSPHPVLRVPSCPPPGAHCAQGALWWHSPS